MKKLIFLFVFLCLIACSSDSPIEANQQTDDEVVMEEEMQEESSSLLENLLIIGKTQDQNSGNFNIELYEHRIGATYTTNVIQIDEQLGIADLGVNRIYLTDDGIIKFNFETNPSSGFKGYFPYYKNFSTGVVNGYNEFITDIFSLNTAGDYKGDIYGFYADISTFDSSDNSYENVLKIIDSNDFSERELVVDRFFSGPIITKQIGDYLYIYHKEDFPSTPVNSLYVLDLNTFQILDTVTNIIDEDYLLASDSEGNGYLLSETSSYKYDIQSKNLEQRTFNFGNLIPSSIFYSQEVDLYVANNKLFGAIPGPQPGSQIFNPIIHDLTSGETQFFDFFDEITQFEQDPFEWQPINTSITFDLENEVFFLGVSSFGLSPSATSFGVFLVDFNGNILEKRKIPIFSIKIIN